MRNHRVVGESVAAQAIALFRETERLAKLFRIGRELSDFEQALLTGLARLNIQLRLF